MEITSAYVKKRKDFGRQPLFCEVPVHLIDSIDPDPSEYKNYILRNPVHQAVQVSKDLIEHTINTTRIINRNQGVNHDEGGWPKDVNHHDEEVVLRYLRRAERDDAYVDAVKNSFKKFEHLINQNNAIEIYEMYFSLMEPETPIEKYSVTIKNVYTDHLNRPVSCIAWTKEDEAKLVVTYCDRRYPIHMSTLNKETEFSVWNVENVTNVELIPPRACWQVDCSPTSPSVIVGGMEDGRVCIFDMRASETPEAISPIHLAHRDPITALLYIQSRTNTEFFSGSTDGTCMWWDIRKLSDQIETMPIIVNLPPGTERNLSRAEPVSCLQFDRAFPTRFLCGTDTGLIINVNRKGKTLGETMTSIFKAHVGPVKAVHRSPLTTKMFISCGDWRVNIWSDEITHAPIISGTGCRYPVNDVCWSPQRISTYMSISADGKLRVFDLLRKYKAPILSYPISQSPLLKIEPHEEGRFIAIGNAKGKCYLIKLSESLVCSDPRDKPVMLQTYERETRRERIIENRIKEIRLKLRTEEVQTMPTDIVDYESSTRETEIEYKKGVANEYFKAGMTASKHFTK